eukprot:s704_g10.t2
MPGPPADSLSGPGSSAGLHDLFELRRKSMHRKHGDPFPLPRLRKDAEAGWSSEFTSLPRRVDECLRCLNELAAVPFHDTVSDDRLDWTDVQEWMFSDLARRILEHGAPPIDLDGPGALRELCSEESLYSQEAAHLANFDSSKVKILHRSLNPTDTEELLPPESTHYLNHFRELIERPQRDIEAICASDVFPQPYWDPSLKRSRKKRLELYALLWKANLLTFRSRRKARARLFVVKKKDGAQRLIIDARQANACHHRPPTTQLSTGAGMVSLDLSPASLESQGFSVVGGNADQCCFESGDVADCFYNFQVKKLASWFAFDDKFTVGELRGMGFDIQTIYDDLLERDVTVSDSDWVYACFGGLPMGWSWALYFAHETIVYQCGASRGFDSSDVIRDRQRPPEVQPGRPAMGIYVDNVHAFAGSMGQASSRIDEVCKRFEQLGIPFVVDHVETALKTDSLGMTLDFHDQCRARPKSRRAWRLWFANHEVIKRPRLHGRILQVLLGHLVHHFQLSRSAMSILSACYRFVADHWFHRAPIWMSVKRELRQCLGMLFIVEYNMSAETCLEVHLGDSSDMGYSLMSTQSTHQEIRDALRDRERWRFITSMERCSGPALDPGGFVELPGDVTGIGAVGHEHQESHYVGCSAHPSVGVSTQYGQEVSKRKAKFTGTRCRPKPRFLTAEPTMIAGPPIPEISQSWSQPHRWQLITAKAWADPDSHINEKEGRVCLMGLRRLVRSVKNLGKLAFSICDNLSCVLAFEKGRSSSCRMNFLCRRAAAYQLAGGIHWRLRHIRSDLNVADRPSRQFGSKPKVNSRSSPMGAPQQMTDEMLGSYGHMPSGEDIRTETLPSRPVQVNNPDNGKLPICLEIFSGSGKLSFALKERGLPTMPAVDFLNGPEFNLLRQSTQRCILRLLASGRIKYVHFGTPCRVFSRARHNLKDLKKARRHEAEGVAMAIFTVRCIRVLLRVGGFFSIENPLNSRLWDFSPIQSLFKHRGCLFVRWDMCRYFTTYKKPTGLLTNLAALSGLGGLCTGGHRHEHLRGSASRRIGGEIKSGTKASFAGEYPSALCEHWASLVYEALGSKTYSQKSMRYMKSQSFDKGGRKRKLPERVDLQKQPITGPHKLAALKVTQKTLDKYQLEIERFSHWLAETHGKNPSFKNLTKLDQQVGLYLNYLHDDVEVEPHHASYLIYGLQLLHNTGPKTHFLCLSKESLAGWRKQQPGRSRLPMPEECVFDVARAMMDSGHLDLAMAVVLQFHCYLRPTEVLTLTKDHVARPSVGRYRKWGLVISPFEMGIASKNGSFDDAVVIADVPGFDWIGIAMGLYMKHVQHELFPDRTLAKYEEIMGETAASLRYSPGVFLPHVLRHSGPSCDHYHSRRDLNEIQRRGRWLARSSVRRYEKHAVLIRQWRTVPTERHADILRQSQNFPSHFTKALRQIDHGREPFSPNRHQEASSSSWLPLPAPPAPRPAAPPAEAAQAASSPKMLPAPVPDQIPEIVRSIDRPLPSVRSRVQQMEEAAAATARDARDRRPLRPPPGGLGRSSFGQLKVPTPRHGPHAQEVVAPPPPKAPSRKASPAPRPQEIQAHFVDYQDSHEARSRRMSPAGSSEPLSPQSPARPAVPSSQEDIANQAAPQLPHLLCRPGRMAPELAASEEAKPDSTASRLKESHSDSEADSCRRGRRSAVVCGSDRKVSEPGRSDSSVDMAALEAPRSPQGGSSSCSGSLQDRINQQMDKELSSRSPSEAGDTEALEAAPQVDELPFAALQQGALGAHKVETKCEAAPALAEDITLDDPFADVTAPAEAPAEAAPALAEDITLDDPFAEVTAPAEARNIVRGAHVPESATQDDVAEEPAVPAVGEDITLDDPSAEVTVPGEINQQMDKELISSSPSEAGDTEALEAAPQVDDLPFAALQQGALGAHKVETKCEAAPALAEDITPDDPFADVTAPSEAPAEAAPALAEDITLDAPFAEVTAPAEARNIVRGADLSLIEVPESATQDDVAEEPVQSPEAVPAVAEDITPDGPFAEVIVPGEDAKQIMDGAWEQYICDQKHKENLAKQAASSHTEAAPDEETVDTLSAPLAEADEPEQQEIETDHQADEPEQQEIETDHQADEPEQQEIETDHEANNALGAETARLRDEENVSEYTGSEGELSKATSSCGGEMQDTSLGEIAEKAEESIQPAEQKAEESEEPAKEQAQETCEVEKEQGTPGRSEEVAELDTIRGAWRGESLSPQHRTSSSRVWHILRFKPLPPPKAEDNWEMSSCGDDLDDEEHELMLEKLRVDKHVPSWCENYLELVHQQHDWDPDSIFGQVPTCDLEEVLPDSIYQELGEKRSYPRKPRKSEADWSRDRLTDINVEDYKMKLGHTKAWIADVDALSPTQRAMIEGFGGESRRARDAGVGDISAMIVGFREQHVNVQPHFPAKIRRMRLNSAVFAASTNVKPLGLKGLQDKTQRVIDPNDPAMAEAWDPAQIQLVQSGQPHDGVGLRRIAVEKHRRRLVLTGGRDGSISISELKTLQVKAQVPKDDPELPTVAPQVGHRDSIEGLAWLPQDQRLFVSGSRDGFIKIWDAEGASGPSVAMPMDLHSSVRHVAINSQAKVACGLDDSTLRLVDLRSGSPVNTMQGHTKPPLSVVWGSEDQLFSGGMDGTVRAWDTRMGARSLFLCDPYAHEGEVVLKRKAEEKTQVTEEQDTRRDVTGMMVMLNLHEDHNKEAKVEPYRFRSMGRVLGTDRRFEDGSVRQMAGSDSFLELEPTTRGKNSKGTPEHLRTSREEFSKDAELKRRAVTSVCFVDGRLLSCGVDGKVRCWDPKTGHLQAEAAKVRKGKHEAAAWREVNVECGREEQSMQMAALGYPDEVCLIPEEDRGEFLAVYSLRSARCFLRLAAHKGAVQGCEAWDQHVLSAGSDGLLLHWRRGERHQGQQSGSEVISLDD